MMAVVAMAWATYACSAAPAAAPNSDGLQAQLQRDTGVAWGVAMDPHNHSPRMLTPALPIHIGAGSPDADARAFFARYASQLGAAGHELRVTVDEKEYGGGHYVRFQHYLAGTSIPVFYVVSTAHFTPDGGMYSAEPGFRAGLDAIAHTPKLSAADATRAAIAAAMPNCGAGASGEPPELGVMGEEALPLALEYRVQLGFSTRKCPALKFDIDATTGAVLRMLPAEPSELVR